MRFIKQNDKNIGHYRCIFKKYWQVLYHVIKQKISPTLSKAKSML
ncbi:hypothetical protein AOT82_2795 [Psychrobacter sp. AntiMn-1]|nr:hypothetical protein AOT82_2795 [Psychrobacter sp. AntiMn-1]